jgi:hypothetical protein
LSLCRDRFGAILRGPVVQPEFFAKGDDAFVLWVAQLGLKLVKARYFNAH